MYTCLGCDASFGTWKQLSAHASQCRLNLSLADQVFEHKCKSSKRHTKNEKRVCPIPAAGSTGPSIPCIDTTGSMSLDQEVDMFDQPAMDVFDQGADVLDDSTEVSQVLYSLHIIDSHYRQESMIISYLI